MDDLKNRSLHANADGGIGIATKQSRWRLPGLIVLILMGFGLSATAAIFDAWDYRLTLTFDRDTGEALTDFPVLMELGEHLTGFEYSQFKSDDGADLRFTAADEETELAYEIERWNTNGVSTVWLRMPELRGTGEVVNVYWGVEGVAAPPYTTNGAVWANDYRGVWHLSETNILAGQTGGIHSDSTTNAVNGSQLYNYSSNGVAGGGQYFNGSSAYINFGNPDPVKITSDLTLSVWVKPEVLTGERGLLSKWSSSWCWALQDGVNRLYFSVWRDASVAIGVGEWAHVAAVYDATAQEIRLYVNGQLRGTHAQTSGPPGTTADLYLGHRGVGGPSLFQGWMDEARLAAAARSSAWMEASYLTVASNDWFTAYAEATPQATNLAVVARSASDIGGAYATLNGRVLHAGEAENPDIYFCWGSSDGLTNATTDWEHVIGMGTNWGGGDAFSTNITGLVSGSTYVYRAYVTNSTGEDWSGPVSFTTPVLPVIDNEGPVWARRRQVSLAGDLLSDGGYPTLVWVECWPDGDPVITSAVAGTLDEEGFEIVVDGLAPATLYYYRFGASNAAGVVWSAMDTFTTVSGDPMSWYVSADGLETLGSDWETAFAALQPAILAAETGDTIHIKSGEYLLDEELIVSLAADLSIIGGYAGVGAPGPTGAVATVIRRNPAVDWTRLAHIHASTVSLARIDFRNGRLPGDSNRLGAGLYITGPSSVTIDACIIADCSLAALNAATSRGAGLYIENGTLNLINSRIENNSMDGGSWAYENSNGAGLAAVNGDVVISNVVFINNINRFSNGPGRGGGVYLLNGQAVVYESDFTGNQVQSTRWHNQHHMGGGLYAQDVNPLIIRGCRFTGNQVRSEQTAEPRNGGDAIHLQGIGLSAHISDTVVASNGVPVSNRVANAIVITSQAKAAFERVRIVDNYGHGIAHGMAHANTAAHFSNVLVAGHAGHGFVGYNGTATLRNLTVANNAGWGVTNINAVVSSISSIVWDNTEGALSGMSEVSYSCVADGHVGEGNIDMNPRFANPAARDYHLMSVAGRWDPVALEWINDNIPSSPCIRAGDPDDDGWQLEPEPNGGRINMGVHGGKAFASKAVPFGIMISIQ